MEKVIITSQTAKGEGVEKQYCMPDEVNTREEHEQYLKAIGHEKYIKEFKNFDSEELFGKHFNGLHYDDLTPERIQQYAVEFAKYHVEKAVKSIHENLPLANDSIEFLLGCYPKENVI